MVRTNRIIIAIDNERSRAGRRDCSDCAVPEGQYMNDG